MSGAADRLIAQLRAARLSWLDLSSGLKVQLLRPTEVEMITNVGRGAFEVACAQVVGWSGFTEADLLGPEVGSDVVAEFTAELWEAYAADHADQTAAVAKEVRRITEDYWVRRKEQTKN